MAGSDLPASTRPASHLPKAAAPRTCRVHFEVISELREVETLATGGSLRLQRRLVKRHGRGRWRKMKGVAMVRLGSGAVVTAELHWYEAHGIGRRELKIKRLL